MHLQLTGSDWHQLESRGDLPAPHTGERHWLTSSNEHWMRACLGYPHSDVATEFHLKSHWKMLLVGQQVGVVSRVVSVIMSHNIASDRDSDSTDIIDSHTIDTSILPSLPTSRHDTGRWDDEP